MDRRQYAGTPEVIRGAEALDMEKNHVTHHPGTEVVSFSPGLCRELELGCSSERAD